MKALVTGGTGFVGSHIVDALVEEGHSIKILATCSNEAQYLGKSWINKNAELIKGSITNLSDLERALDDVGVVFHQAALRGHPEISKLYEINVVGTANIFDTIKRKGLDIQKIILASSNVVYGEGKYKCPNDGEVFYPNPRPKEQLENGQWELKCQCGSLARPIPTDESSPLKPTSVYAQTKIAAEWITISSGKTLNIPTAILRVPLVYGPREYKRVCQIFSTNLYKQKAITLNEDGRQIRSFINVADVVRANVFAAKTDINGIFNIGPKFSTTLLDFIKKLGETLGVEPRLNLTGNYREGDLRHNIMDCSKIEHFGFEPSICLEEGLKQYKSWIKKEYGLEEYFNSVENALSSK